MEATSEKDSTRPPSDVDNHSVQFMHRINGSKLSERKKSRTWCGRRFDKFRLGDMRMKWAFVELNCFWPFNSSRLMFSSGWLPCVVCVTFSTHSKSNQKHWVWCCCCHLCRRRCCCSCRFDSKQSPRKFNSFEQEYYHALIAGNPFRIFYNESPFWW